MGASSSRRNNEILQIISMKHYLFLLSVLFVPSCVQHTQLTVVDECLNPNRSSIQLHPDSVRGSMGISYFNRGEPKYINDAYRVYGKESWILRAWGPPDEIRIEKSIKYFTYNSSRTSYISSGSSIGRYPVVLGYEQGRLCYASAYFVNSNFPAYMKKNSVYVLPSH